MPAISLVVCLHRERALLERLLEVAKGCFDDLVVVHDGPEVAAGPALLEPPLAIDFALLAVTAPPPQPYRAPSAAPVPESTQALVERAGGRYFEGPRSLQQEPHWPFAWSQARHPWILRLDADEAPSPELREWLRNFRQAPEPEPAISGFNCVWPLWDGARIISRRWPGGRTFLFHRDRVRFFGMVEQTPIADERFEDLPLILEHRPKRKSFGFRNIFLRRQAYAWRYVIARSLLGSPLDLARWRWDSPQWPGFWESLRQRPLRTGLRGLIRGPFHAIPAQLRTEGRVFLGPAFLGGIYHFMIALRLALMKLTQSAAGGQPPPKP